MPDVAAVKTQNLATIGFVGALRPARLERVIQKAAVEVPELLLRIQIRTPRRARRRLGRRRQDLGLLVDKKLKRRH